MEVYDSTSVQVNNANFVQGIKNEISSMNKFDKLVVDDLTIDNNNIHSDTSELLLQTNNISLLLEEVDDDSKNDGSFFEVRDEELQVDYVGVESIENTVYKKHSVNLKDSAYQRYNQWITWLKKFYPLAPLHVRVRIGTPNNLSIIWVRGGSIGGTFNRLAVFIQSHGFEFTTYDPGYESKIFYIFTPFNQTLPSLGIIRVEKLVDGLVAAFRKWVGFGGKNNNNNLIDMKLGNLNNSIYINSDGLIQAQNLNLKGSTSQIKCEDDSIKLCILNDDVLTIGPANDENSESIGIKLNEKFVTDTNSGSKLVFNNGRVQKLDESLSIGQAKNGKFLKTVIENDEILNFSGTIVESGLPKPVVEENGISPVGSILVGLCGAALTMSNITLNDFLTLAYLHHMRNKKQNSNDEVIKSIFTVNDGEYNPDTKKYTYNDALFIMTDELQFNGQQYSLKRNDEKYITMNDNIQFNLEKLKGEGEYYLTIDGDGNIGVETSNKTINKCVKCLVKVKNLQVQLLKSVNVKNVSISGNKISVKLNSKMDIYEPRITIISSQTNISTKVVSNIVDETDIVEFELSDASNEVLLSVNIQ